MPHLKKIDLKSSGNVEAHLKSLINIWDSWNNSNSNNDDAGYMDRLEDISINTSSRGFLTKDYFKLCYALRRTMKHLSLNYFGTTL